MVMVRTTSSLVLVKMHNSKGYSCKMQVRVDMVKMHGRMAMLLRRVVMVKLHDTIVIQKIPFCSL